MVLWDQNKGAQIVANKDCSAEIEAKGSVRGGDGKWHNRILLAGTREALTFQTQKSHTHLGFAFESPFSHFHSLFTIAPTPLGLTFGVDIDFKITFFEDEVIHSIYIDHPQLLSSESESSQLDEESPEESLEETPEGNARENKTIRHNIGVLLQNLGIPANLALRFSYEKCTATYERWTVTEDDCIEPDTQPKDWTLASE